MGKLALAVTAVALLTSCAHGVKNVADLKINQSYLMIGQEKFKECKLTASNIVTLLPIELGAPSAEVSTQQRSQIAVVPVEEATGAKALVCGKVDCSAIKPDMVAEFECLPIEFLQSSKSE